MIRNFIYNPPFYAHLVVWVLVGSVNTFAVIPLVAISNAMWFRKEEYLEVVLGLLFMTLLSDSRNFSLAFAQTVKALQVVLIFGMFYLKNGSNGIKTGVHTSLILYLLVGIICLFQSPILFESFQKTVSYFLVILVVPNLLYWSYEEKGNAIIRDIVFFLGFLMLTGFAARFLPLPFIDPFLEGRFTGVFGNPNGLAIFGFLFVMFFNLAIHFYPDLFTRREKILLYGLAALSIISSGSRGALLATLAFLAFRYYGYRFGLAAFAVVVSLIISFEFAIELIAETTVSLGLGEFFRVETLESGSGRVIAIEFAWENIQKNYWLGLGIGYGDYLFKENYYELAMLGHQGQVHNAYLNVWLDTGLIGLSAFILGWGNVFLKALKNTKIVWGVIVGVFISTNAEVWIVGSLSPWMITFLCLITMLVYMAPVEETVPEANPETKPEIKDFDIRATLLKPHAQ